MAQLGQALFQLIHDLKSHSAWRVENVTLYLTTVDQNGQEVSLNGKAVWKHLTLPLPRPTIWMGAAARCRVRFLPKGGGGATARLTAQVDSGAVRRTCGVLPYT
jgi:hypothetical protein